MNKPTDGRRKLPVLLCAILTLAATPALGEEPRGASSASVATTVTSEAVVEQSDPTGQVSSSEPAPLTSETLLGAKVVSTGLTLQDCLRMASINYPKIAEALARLDVAQAQEQESNIAPYTDFSATGGIVAAPTVRGTNVYSRDTDASLRSDMGLAWQLGFSGTVPLWTFGKIANLQAAAEHQVVLKRHELRQSRDEVALQVRRAFYGVLFARDTAILLDEVQKHINKSLKRLTDAVEAEEADEVALLKLRMYDAELRARRSELTRQQTIAMSGLRFLIGSKADPDLVDEPLPGPRHKLAPLSYYLTVARIHRPEVNMARAGVLARQAQLEVDRAKYFPDIGALVNFNWSQAPEVTDQRNPFVRDPGNFLIFAVGIGLKWKLDFFAQSARVTQAESRLREVEATERFALGGIATEVEKAYAEAKDAETQLSVYSEAASYARKWLVIVQQGLDVGAYDEEELVAPAKEYALKRFAEMNATFEYNVAMARLAQATGWSTVADDP